MPKMRVLITDGSPNSLEAAEDLRKKKISFVELSIEKISQVDFKVPMLLAPEGRFEGVNLVKAYSKAEVNGFHKKLEKKTTRV